MAVTFSTTKHRTAALLATAIVIFTACDICCRRRPKSPPQTAAATLTTTAPVGTTLPTTGPALRHTYLDVVKANYSDFPATQPLTDILDLAQAAHLHFSEPLYLSPYPRAELWITRPDAPPIDTVLREAADASASTDAHVINREVAFVDWIPADSGNWSPYVVCKADGGFEVSWATGHALFKGHYDYRWDSAFAWNRLVVVPTTGGVSILDLTGETPEAHYEFASVSGSASIVPQAQTDLQGIIAWTPWDAHVAGSGEAARFVNGKWSTLTAENGWPGKLVHVVPLLDGSALQLLGSDNGVHLAVTTLEKVDVNEREISALVDQLNDAEAAKRVDAYEQLTRYGPGIWPILEKLAPDQPPEAAERLEQLLQDKTGPTLGGMKLLGTRSLAVANRLADGGVVFYAADGVSIPNPGGEAEVRTPAWICVRPGEPIALLPPLLTADLKPGASHIWAIGDEWIVWSELRGVERFVGSGFVGLLHKNEAAYDELVGIDRRGRWILRKSSTRRVPHEAGGQDFLVIDPTLPDPTPRLPAWTFTTADSVGWDKDGWPVVKRGAAFALMETDWRLVDPKEKIFKGAADAAATTSQPATAPSTMPAKAQNPGECILIAPNGTRYYDGQTLLRSIDHEGKETVWPLPAIATGHAKVHLVRTSDGRLFLFNQGGRILRIRSTTAGNEPFQIEATFTRDVPDTNTPDRMWLDPAGRIDIEWDNRLTILFADGYIPRQIAEKMESAANAP